LSPETLKDRLTPLAKEYGRNWDPTLSRKKRSDSPTVKAPEAQPSRGFRIEAKCKACGNVETVCQPQGTRITTPPSGNCSRCGKTCVFTIDWPDGEKEEDEELKYVLESIHEYNSQFR